MCIEWLGALLNKMLRWTTVGRYDERPLEKKEQEEFLDSSTEENADEMKDVEPEDLPFLRAFDPLWSYRERHTPKLWQRGIQPGIPSSSRREDVIVTVGPVIIDTMCKAAKKDEELTVTALIVDKNDGARLTEEVSFTTTAKSDAMVRLRTRLPLRSPSSDAIHLRVLCPHPHKTFWLNSFQFLFWFFLKRC